MIRRMAVLAALLLMLGAARAETMEALSMQAQTPWRETIEAYGRTLVFDVSAQLPQVEQMGVYTVLAVGLEERRPAPQLEAAPKRRGILQREKCYNARDYRNYAKRYEECGIGFGMGVIHGAKADENYYHGEHGQHGKHRIYPPAVAAVCIVRDPGVERGVV